MFHDVENVFALHAYMQEGFKMIQDTPKYCVLVIVLANPILQYICSMHACLSINCVKSIHGITNDDIFDILDSTHGALLVALHRSFTKATAGCGMPFSS